MTSISGSIITLQILPLRNTFLLRAVPEIGPAVMLAIEAILFGSVLMQHRPPWLVIGHWMCPLAVSTILEQVFHLMACLR